MREKLAPGCDRTLHDLPFGAIAPDHQQRVQPTMTYSWSLTIAL